MEFLEQQAEFKNFKPVILISVEDERLLTLNKEGKIENILITNDGVIDESLEELLSINEIVNSFNVNIISTFLIISKLFKYNKVKKNSSFVFYFYQTQSCLKKQILPPFGF